MAENRYMVPIPEPKTEGDVLTVVNGEWQGAEPSGGATGLVVSVSGSPKSMALDKSYNELKIVLDNGIMPVFNMHTEEEGQPTFDMYNFVLLGLVTAEVEGATIYQAILRMDSTDGGDPTFLEMGALDGDSPLAEVY